DRPDWRDPRVRHRRRPLLVPGRPLDAALEPTTEDIMTLRFVAFSLLGMLALAALPAAGQEDKKFADLDGTWTITRMEIEGRSLLGKDEKWKLVIKNGKVTSDARKAPREAVDLSKFLDPSRTPKTITYPYEGQ